MKKVVSLMGLALVVLSTMTGCSHVQFKPLSEGVREVEWVDGSGKLLNKYTEIRDETGQWYEAEKVGDKWQLSPAGRAKKESGRGDSGGGGGSC